MRLWRGEIRQGGTSEMAGDVVSLCASCAAVLPLAGEAEIVGALATDVVVAEMVVEGLWVIEGQLTVQPETAVGGLRGIWRRRGTGGGRRGRGGQSRRHVQVGNNWQMVLEVHDVLKRVSCQAQQGQDLLGPTTAKPRQARRGTEHAGA
jgi:hypothetical protein